MPAESPRPALPTSLRAEREALVAAAIEAGDLATLPRRYAALADAFLEGLLLEATDGDPKGYALVGVGGYGRSELCPGSDLDVVLLHKGGRRELDRVAQHIWYRVWDDGNRLDHSVRTVREAIAVARTDLKAALGLLDARIVAGDAAAAGDLRKRMQELFRAHARGYLEQLDTEVHRRHETAGELAFLLEPDLKEAHGGLRDVHALRSICAALPALQRALRIDALDGPAATILLARTALHARTGRGGDRLVLQEQDEIAPMLGHPDADSLMKAIAEAGREIARASDDGWRRVRSQLAGPAARASGSDRAIATGLVLRDGDVTLEPGWDLAGDEGLLLRAAELGAQEGLSLSPDLLERLAADAVAPSEPWSDEVRHSFVSVLGGADRAVVVLEALDRHRLLERLLPEWREVRNLPQRNAYHRYTVDRHLVETVARAGPLVRRVARPDLLLVVALLHDIGKGFPGDHTAAGVEIAPVVARRMGFSEDDASTVARLVANHLLLAETATRRDLEDPVTIERVAEKVGDPPTLELLAALTEADSLATGPAAWGEWKARLVAELVRLTAERLAGGADHGRSIPAPPTGVGSREVLPAALKRAVAEHGIGVAIEQAHGATVITVAANDRPGLLAVAAGVLCLHGLEVRSATASESGGGLGVERFLVEPRFGRTIDDWRIEMDLRSFLEGTLSLERRLDEQSTSYGRSRRPSAAQPVDVRVLVDNDASARATLVEVRAPDSHGLLHRIARHLCDAGLDVVSAHASTLGHEAVDTFYVRDVPGGAKIRDQQLIDSLRLGLSEAARPR